MYRLIIPYVTEHREDPLRNPNMFYSHTRSISLIIKGDLNKCTGKIYVDIFYIFSISFGYITGLFYYHCHYFAVFYIHFHSFYMHGSISTNIMGLVFSTNKT